MLREISIARFASIKHPIKLSFGKINLIIGGNGTGKSAICDAIACLFEYKNLFELQGRISGELVLLKAEVVRNQKEKYTLQREIKFREKKIIEDSLIMNGVESSNFINLQSILKVIYFRGDCFQDIRDDRDIARFCISHLAGWTKGLKRHHFLALKSFARQYNSVPARLIEAIEWQPSGKLRVKKWDSEFWLPCYGNLSSGEKYWLLVDIALLLSEISSQYYPTLILLDDCLTHLSDKSMEIFAERINSYSNPNFQLLLTTWKEQAGSIVKPDCTIKLGLKDKRSYVLDMQNRTPQGLLDIEARIKAYNSGDEDRFINSVVIPLLQRMGFYHLDRVTHHGPGELGLDIGPFHGAGFEWRNSFCGAQVKTSKLNARSGSSFSINILIDEVRKALNNKFYDSTSSFKSHLDYILIFLSQDVTKEALSTFFNAFEGDRRVILLNPMKIAELAWKYGVSLY